MILPQRHLTAEVEAVRIESQLLNLFRSWVEVVARIKGVIAVELPRGRVELFGSGLDHRGDGRRSSQSILGAVVRGQVSELANGVQRRHDAAAAAAAVEIFAAIEELQVVA